MSVVIFFQNAGLSQQIDKRIIGKIHELVQEGIRAPHEMERHIKMYVKTELFSGNTAPSKSNRRFYPKRSDIRSHIFRAITKHRFSKIDQENVFSQIKKWKVEYPSDRFFFRSYGGDVDVKVYSENADITDELQRSTNNRLLFVHQTAQQQRLVQRYGQNLCLLDATYKTTKYAIPLFFVATKTNMDY